MLTPHQMYYLQITSPFRTSLVAQTVKCLPTVLYTRVQSLGWEDLLEKEMAPHTSILAWKIPWMEKPGRPQSMGLQRVGHNWVTSLSLFPSQQVAFLFLLLVSFAVQKLFSLISHICLFLLCFCCLGRLMQKKITNTNIKWHIVYVPSKNVIISGLKYLFLTFFDFFFFFFFAMLHGLWNLSSSIRNHTWALCSGSMES